MNSNLIDTFNQLTEVIKTNKDPNNYELARVMIEIAKFSDSYILNGWSYTGRFDNSKFRRSSLEYFNQDIKNKLFKNSFHKININGYICLKILELLNDQFKLEYTVSLSNYLSDYNKSFSVGEKRCYVEFDESEFVECTTSSQYNDLLKTNIPSYVDEYNKAFNANESLASKEIDLMFQYVEINDRASIINYLYHFPFAYEKLKSIANCFDSKLLLNFLSSYKCKYSNNKKNKKALDCVIKDVIHNNFFDDKDLFYTVVQTPRMSHMALYFSDELKNELKKNISSAAACYKNTCSMYEPEIKSMLGKKLISSKEFRYIFG